MTFYGFCCVLNPGRNFGGSFQHQVAMEGGYPGGFAGHAGQTSGGMPMGNPGHMTGHNHMSNTRCVQLEWLSELA